jgi:hypothetical protein
MATTFYVNRVSLLAGPEIQDTHEFIVDPTSLQPNKARDKGLFLAINCEFTPKGDIASNRGRWLMSDKSRQQ